MVVEHKHTWESVSTVSKIGVSTTVVDNKKCEKFTHTREVPLPLSTLHAKLHVEKVDVEKMVTTTESDSLGAEVTKGDSWAPALLDVENDSDPSSVVDGPVDEPDHAHASHGNALSTNGSLSKNVSLSRANEGNEVVVAPLR